MNFQNISIVIILKKKEEEKLGHFFNASFETE